ncbi:MAG: DUF3089 domain-containing protein [Sphingomonadaceae bacterium]
MPSAVLLAFLAATSPVTANDYTRDANWLCLPARRDACAVDSAVSRIGPGDTIFREPAQPRRAPIVDCFYVYPTTSLDAAGTSDMIAGQEERNRVAEQFARFADACRTYAPLYRQVTLTALRARMRDASVKLDFETGYRDIRDAWRHYLAHDNRGRPFVLIGHSQGSLMLQRLVREEIDGKPVQRRMLSAILPGMSLLVPRGKDVGGDFKAIPLCRAETQTGCAITWSSYRDTNPPPANALFGVSKSPAMEAACTNPARLSGGAAPLDAIFGFPWWRGGVGLGAPPEGWQRGGKPIATRFARVPGRLTGECVRGTHGHFLSVRVNIAPVTAFDRELTDPAVIGDDAYPDWGFHVVDIAIVHGDLLRIVNAQAQAWRKARR